MLSFPREGKGKCKEVETSEKIVSLPFESVEAKHKWKSMRISMKWLQFYCNRLKIDTQICNNNNERKKKK